MLAESILSKMGITQWKLRNTVGLKPLNEPVEARYAIFLGEERSLNSEEKVLLKNLLQAIQWPMKYCLFLQWTQQSKTAFCVPNSIEKSLSFGKMPNPFFTGVCELPPIQALLSQPNQKKAAWQKLRSYSKSSLL